MLYCFGTHDLLRGDVLSDADKYLKARDVIMLIRYLIVSGSSEYICMFKCHYLMCSESDTLLALDFDVTISYLIHVVSLIDIR